MVSSVNTTALARKWRPRNFEQLAGQVHVVKALENALTQNRLHHAYLFTGTRGVGKTTIARIFAKSLNCIAGVSAQPCGQCDACTEIDAGRFIDLIELDAASNTQVDSMRELLDSALYAPTSGRYKVYIIDEVHMLSKSAFNAMLKTLEEPPEHVKFILATTDPQKIPVTVLSRCLQFNLKQLPPALICEHLEHILGLEQINYERPALQLVAQAAHGSMRDALSLMDQAIAFSDQTVAEDMIRNMLGSVDKNYLFRILEALLQQSGEQLLNLADQMSTMSISFDNALQELASLIHKITLAQTSSKAISDDELDKTQIIQLAEQLPAEDLQLYYQIAIHGRNELELAPDEYAGFTMTLLRMLAFAPVAHQATSSARPTPARPTPARPTPGPTSTATSANPARPQPADKQAPNSAPRANHLAEQTTQPGATAAASVAPPSANAGDADWMSIVAQLGLQGMALQLAKNCSIQSQQGNQLALQLAPQQKHLQTRMAQEKLETAVKHYFGADTLLKIELHDSQQATPAIIEQQNKQQQQQNAEQSIQQDPFVQQAQQQLGASIIPGSIKPV